MSKINTIDGNTSDGYHTFDELYKCRHALFIALLVSLKHLAWRANNHDDGDNSPGWFIAGLHLPTGDISFHLPNEMWSLLDYHGIATTNRAPKFDGHNTQDCIHRLNNYCRKYEDGDCR